jgi:hypothetical protein
MIPPASRARPRVGAAAAESAAGQTVEILIVTVVWGDWHLRAFLDVNLPTLLAPGNLPALFVRHRGTYRIYTRAADISRIEGSATFQRLATLVPIEVEVIEDEERLRHPIQTHVEIWRDAVAQATKLRKFALLMPPDVLWSDGSFGHVADLLAQGKCGIYAAFMRATSNTLLPAFHARFGAHPDRVVLSGMDLVRLCLEHLHPLTAAYARTSDYFPYHTEMIIWPVRDEGLIVRVLARELLIYDPSRIQLNQAQLITGCVPWEALHMVSDSDHLFGVSLAPLGKDASWHRVPGRTTTREVGRWWGEYDSPANDYVASVKLRWHFRPVTEAAWRQRQAGGNLFVRRAALEREALRVVAHIFNDQAGRAVLVGRLLALLVMRGKVARAMRAMPRLQTRPIFVFVPADAALGPDGEAAGVALAEMGDGRAERLLREHVAIATLPVDLDRLREVQTVTLEFLSGARRGLKHSRRAWSIDGITVTKIERASETLVICYAAGILGACSQPEVPRQGAGTWT